MKLKTYEVCDFRYDEGLRNRVDKYILPSICCQSERGGLSGKPMAIEKQIRIRKLTPKECYRLMGFSDEDYEKAKSVVSDSQLYKQAGNSIVVDVLEAIFREML